MEKEVIKIEIDTAKLNEDLYDEYQPSALEDLSNIGKLGTNIPYVGGKIAGGISTAQSIVGTGQAVGSNLEALSVGGATTMASVTSLVTMLIALATQITKEVIDVKQANRQSSEITRRAYGEDR
jgi:hypothetical protein